MKNTITHITIWFTLVALIGNCQSLQEATRKGDLDAIRSFVSSGADLNATDDNGKTALLYAAIEGNTEAATILLQAGADPNVADKSRFTALHYAARNDFPKVVSLLLLHKANIKLKANVSGDTGTDWTALILAARNKNSECLQLLLNAGAEVNAASSSGWTALHFAAREDDLESAKRLIANGARLNDAEEDGFTPLLIASHNGLEAMSSLLIDKGASVTQASMGGVTPLHNTAKKNTLHIAERLIQKGANVNAQTKSEQNTPLHYAAKYNSFEVAALLVKKSRVNVQNAAGHTPLLLAAANNADRVVLLLADNHVDVNAVHRIKSKKNNDFSEFTPLQAAAANCSTNSVRALLSKGAEKNFQTSDGLTAFKIAVFAARENSNCLHTADLLRGR
ncbi:MAG: ankyrin repeat domain-containing protein [Leptospiraceae bacterium]|nr:ankyrin repeat domain-containing protein [Leptospiraceae bacterium]